MAFLFQPPPAGLILTIILFCVASFAVGLGPGVWVMMSELFPTRIRGRAMSIATISLWVACVALTLTFLSLVKAITVVGRLLGLRRDERHHLRIRMAGDAGDEGQEPRGDREAVAEVEGRLGRGGGQMERIPDDALGVWLEA